MTRAATARQARGEIDADKVYPLAQLASIVGCSATTFKSRYLVPGHLRFHRSGNIVLIPGSQMIDRVASTLRKWDEGDSSCGESSE